MKHLKSSLIVCGMLAICAVSCRNETLQKESQDIEFEFRLLTENGVPANTFKSGENFLFSFIIINNSDQPWSFLQKLDDRHSFFRVYQLSADTQEGGEVKDVGRPWETIFCQYRLGLLIPPHDTLKLEIPWIPEPPAWNADHPRYNSIFCQVSSNTALPPGRYKTGFTSAFKLLNGEDISYNTEKKTFEILFEVQ